ncbi:hypothetical protein LINPERPRIM_LOCUS5207 [Linum perenne]
MGMSVDGLPVTLTTFLLKWRRFRGIWRDS